MVSIKERMATIEEANKKLMEERKSLVEQLGVINRRIGEIDSLAQQQVGAHNALKEVLAETEKPVEVTPTETEH